MAIVLEAASMASFAMMQGRLLQVGGRRVRAKSMLATIFAANSLSGSVPVAGPELGAALSYRRFRKEGANPALATWTLVVGGVVSWGGAFVVLATGGLLSGHLAIVALSVSASFAVVLTALLAKFGSRSVRVRQCVARAASTAIRPISRLWSKHGDPLVAIASWIGSLGSLRPSRSEWGKIGALGLGNWLTDVAVLATSIAALGGVVPWRSLLVVYGLATLIGGLGLTPGGLGLVEGTLCLGLVSAGIPATLALGAVLLYRLVSYWFVVFIGWFVLAWLRLERQPRLIAIAETVPR
jgi:hypothetical protein